MNEPSVVAVRIGERGPKKVLAVGEEAKKMLGKTPSDIIAKRPLRDGVIADFEATEVMLEYFIKKSMRDSSFMKFIRPRVVIGVPSGITSVERRAVIESAEAAGAREVYLIDEPMAAAIGINLPVSEPVGNMVVDIGGGTTEVAVISLAGTVCSTSIKIAGDEMDEAIVQYIRKRYNMLIGERTAEQIKMDIGAAIVLSDDAKLDVKGRDIITGIPKQIELSQADIVEALAEPVSVILATVKETLEKTPPELSADIFERGIFLTGGGALLRGIDQLVSKDTGLPVYVAEDPLTAVAKGCGKVVDDIELLKKIATV